ncbi:TPA: glycosyltransferase family 2 protein [Escherichia coli]|mgnify:FL=1|uniref:glycosyltransferase family 2 protein n=1 Tax=Escherichia coli TaxID=562 RepID=UPI0017535701|nr:glycosyltransferase family 2 protein [Escherichia coli]MCN6099947.1 glycosyltransferase [Escherichia coli]MDF3967378.1 glycosyltransferase family 2 protein [Escherichia coli]HAJ0427940.1 glycosyltransferase family 2 protein [Escherichia coli]HAM5023010.1 glycosyltransferase family 2 protein [Escherichia coli]HAW7697420.1 glycosyltransferase family 2 protein [Escherichia coli]
MTILSIIIPVYNSSSCLEDALKSVVIQNLDSYEIIVVDDGSTKEEHYACIDICKQYANTKLVTKENGGAASARNFGAKKARGILLAFLDSDDVWLKNKILSQIGYLKTQNADLVLGNIIVTDYFLNAKYKANKKISKNKYSLIKDLFYGKVIMNTPTILVTKDMFIRVGGFDESLKYREDHSFLIDVVGNGNGKIVLDPAYNTLRRERENSLSSVCDIYSELDKHMPFWLKFEKKYSFLITKKARKKLLSSLCLYYIRNERDADIKETLRCLKNDSYFLYLCYRLLTNSSSILSLLYTLRNKLRNAAF